MHRHLIATLAMGAIATVATAAPPPGPTPPPADAAAARAILKELVEIDTTHSHGTMAAAKAIEAHLLAAGFAPADLQLLAPADKPTKGNLIVRYHGTGKNKPILFIGHLDVVEARPEDWSVDPFKLTEKDGYFYGRGSEDMKDGDAVLTEALIRLKREGYVPDRDIIVAFTADEEAGGENGPEWLLKTHRDLVEAETVYNFDGGAGAWKGSKRLGYGFGTSEKIYLTFTLETTSPGGHGSLPGPDNAIYRLAEGLGRIEAYTFPARTTATTRAAFRADAALETGQKRADLLAVAKAEHPDPLAAARLSKTVFYNAELRTTCVATLISGGHAENALPQRAKATIQCRLLPGDTAANVQATLVKVLKEPKISVTMDAPPIVSPESPPTPEVTRRITAVVHDMWPGVPVKPVMSTGFSDDRQFRSAGMPSYDVGGLWEELGENRAHGRDERIGAQAFDEDTEYTYRLLKAFGSEP